MESPIAVPAAPEKTARRSRIWRSTWNTGSGGGRRRICRGRPRSDVYARGHDTAPMLGRSACRLRRDREAHAKGPGAGRRRPARPPGRRTRRRRASHPAGAAPRGTRRRRASRPPRGGGNPIQQSFSRPCRLLELRESSFSSDLDLDRFDRLLLGFGAPRTGRCGERPARRFEIVHARAHNHGSEKTDQQPTDSDTECDRPHALALLEIDPIRLPPLTVACRGPCECSRRLTQTATTAGGWRIPLGQPIVTQGKT
jgi:hypothetical protein